MNRMSVRQCVEIIRRGNTRVDVGMFARHRMFIHLLATVQLTINPLTGATPIADGTSAGSYGTLPPYADSYGTAY